jgi:release factor glutamine methyltransferase
MASPETPSASEPQAAKTEGRAGEAESQWTYGRLLAWTTDFLKKSGSDSPQLDGQILLAHAAGCERIQLFTAYHQSASEAVRTAFRGLVKRRAAGEPVAYLVGGKEFYSLAFRVTPDVLVPRPETEHLVVALLDQMKSQGNGEFTIADVGTGSGCVAIAAAKHAPHCRFLAVDQSEEALAVAQKNAAAHQVADRIEFLHGDLLAPISKDEALDFIVSNPPYISEAEFAQLAPDVRDYEPRAALVAGPKGTEVIERLLTQAADRLRIGGWLFVEISPMIEASVAEFIAGLGRFQQRRTIKDIAGQPRVVQVERVS